MMEHLIKYVMEEGNCSEDRAVEIAYSIMDSVDEMIHERIDEDEDY